MKTLRMVVMLIVVVCGTLAVSACSLTTGSTGGSTGGGTPTAAATATAKAKPSVVPLTDLAFCQHILSLAEANQIMSPPIPATTIVPNNTSNGGSCFYVYSQSGIVLAIVLQPWTGPVPVSQQDIESAVTKIASLPGITVTTYTTVSGVGDQAAFLALSNSSGPNHKAAVFYVLYGRIFFACTNYFNVGSSSDAT